MSRNVLVAIVGLLVFLIVAGAVYLQIWASASRTDLVWAVSRSVQSGDLLTADNVHQVRIPSSGDAWDFFTGDLVGAHARAAHEMSAATIIFKHDVEQRDLALVTISLRTPPPLAHGQTIDVYAQIGTQTQIVGRRLAVEQSSGGTCSIWVPAQNEPSWITLQASNVALYAAQSSGVGVPDARAQGLQDALNTLGGSGAGSMGTTPRFPTSTPSVASPQPTPKKP
jgi:hypothetical protein